MTKNSSGVITVFVTLMLIPLLAFGTLVMEAGRYLSARSLLAEAQTTAAMTVLANYNVYLNERFGLLAIDPAGAGESNEEDYKNSLLYNSDSVSGVSRASQLYSFNKESDWSFETVYDLSDFNVIKRQILEYSKYSVPYEVVSKKLGLDGIFGDFFKMFNLDEISSLLDNMNQKTSKAVEALELSFWELGKVEYYNLDLQNFFGESNTKDNYNTETLYKDYIKKDEEFDSNGKPKSYNDSTNYNKRYKAYMDEVYNKSNYIDNNANPNAKNNAVQAALSNNTVPTNNSALYANIYAVCSYLLEYDNGNNEYSSIGDKTYYISYSTYNATVSGSDVYALSGGSASVSVTANGSSSYGRKVSTAIYNMKNKLGTSSLKISSFDDLETLLKNYLTKCGISYNSSSSSFLTDKKNEAASKVRSYYNAMNKESALSALASTWQGKADTYNTKISDYNTAINNAKQGYIDALTAAVEKFSKYIEKLDSAYTKLEESKDGYAETFDDDDEADENVSKVTGKMDEVKSEFLTEKTNAQAAKTLLETIKSNVSGIDPTVMEDVSHSSGVNYIEKTGENTKYAIGIENATLKGYVGLEGFTKIGEFCETSPLGDTGESSFDLKTVGSLAADALGITDMWNAFKAIGEGLKEFNTSLKNVGDIINPLPAAYEKTYDETIQGTSYNILPGFSSDGSANEADKEYAKSIMENVGKVLGSAYANQLSEITITNANEDDLNAFDEIKGLIDDIFSEAVSMREKGILEMLSAIKNILEKIGQLFSKFIDLVGKLWDMLNSLLEAAYDAVLINTYVVQKFPSRMSSIEDATMYPAEEGTNCTSHEACYFSSCCVEYVFGGDPSETVNQTKVFWIIFCLRAVINCIQILMSEDTMSLVSACNIFAPLMYIALVYMETNIDMNYLVSAGQSVPIWKENVHMSVKGLLAILENLIDVGNITVWKTDSGAGKRYHKSSSCRTLSKSVSVSSLSMTEAKKQGLTGCAVCNPLDVPDDEDDYVQVTYDTYLYILLFFKGGDKKLRNVGELIQLETRYYESKQKGGSVNFKLSEAGTYVRSSANATYSTLLPMFSLGGNSSGFPQIYSLKYTGY